MIVEHVTSRVYVLYVENNKRIAYELCLGRMCQLLAIVCVCVITSQVRLYYRAKRESAWDIAHGDIHSLLANGFHNDMPRGKLGHLIILEGPLLARATLSRPWNNPSLLEIHITIAKYPYRLVEDHCQAIACAFIWWKRVKAHSAWDYPSGCNIGPWELPKMCLYFSYCYHFFFLVKKHFFFSF